MRRSLLLMFLLAPLAAFPAERLPLPQGWFLAGRDAAYSAYTASSSCELPRALVLESKPSTTSGWATVMQTFQADAFRGKRLRFAGTVATRDVKGWSGLWMRVDGVEPHHSLAFDNMQGRAIKGTAGCQRYEVVLDVPKEAVTIAAGVVLEGAGRVELGGVKFEPVDQSVASTNLLGRGVKLGAPGEQPEEKSNELADSSGRVGGAWFNDFAVQDFEVVLHQRNPARWSDANNDSVAILEGDKVKVSILANSGTFRFGRDGDATVIEGEWGKQIKYPVSIRLSHEKLDMKWGFYERHLTREDAAEVDPSCIRFIQYKNTIISASDALYVCGAALEPDAPPVQTTVAFLLAGFHRTLSGVVPSPY